MRILTIKTVIWFGLGAVLAVQLPYLPAQFQPTPPPGGNAPPWMQNAGQEPQRGRQVQGNQQIRQQQGQNANQQAQQGQPGRMSANKVNQILSRLRAMDSNGNGILESNEIPANQRTRVDSMITQLGGRPGNQVNLANLERRALASAGNVQRDQPQQPGDVNAVRQRAQPVVEPLVRPFGETSASSAQASIPAFGQRPANAQPQQANRGGARPQRVVTTSTSLSASLAVRGDNSIKQSAPYDHIPTEVRNSSAFSWFFEYDRDEDAQISMLEYVSGRGGVWTDGIAEEFIWLDRNGDGFATVDEALASISESDEQRPQELGEQPAVTPWDRRQPGTQIRQPPMANSRQTSNSAYQTTNQSQIRGSMRGNNPGRGGQPMMPGGGGRDGNNSRRGN